MEKISGFNMLKKKVLGVAAVSLLLISLAAGCGGGNTAGSTTGGTTAAGAERSAAGSTTGGAVPGSTTGGTAAGKEERPGGSINIQGSDTMVNLGQALAEYYMDNVNPKANLAVTGGGSGTGIAAMINNNTDIAQSSRAMKASELADAEANGVTAHEFVVAQDGMAIVVHDSNPINELTVQQLKDIFTGKITNWSELGWNDGGIISVYSRQSNSGTYVYFNENIMDGEDWAPDTRFMPGSAAIADAIVTDKAGIGYFGVGYVREVGNKVLFISRGPGQPYVTPLDPENVNSGAYPIARPLFFYTNGAPAGLVLDYLQWVLSPEGQEVVLTTGFYKITPAHASKNAAVFQKAGIS